MSEAATNIDWKRIRDMEQTIRKRFFNEESNARHANSKILFERFVSIARAIENGVKIDLGDNGGARRVREQDKDLLVKYMLQIFEDEKAFPTPVILDEYFAAHAKSYLEELDIRLQGSEQLVSVDTKLVVSVAARNELGLEKAIQKLKEDWESSHGLNTFSQEVVVVIFNNYPVGEVVPADAQVVLDKVAQNPGVHVSSEVLDTLDTNAGIPKKIATDMVMRMCQKAGFFPDLLSIDADLADLEEGTVAACLDTLKQPGILAVSPDYDYDPASKVKFPLWGLRCELLKLVRRYDMELNPIKSPRIIGGLYCMKLKTLALIGGVPAEKNQDLEMTITLRDLFSMYWFEHEPIGRPSDQVAVAYFNPSKEIQNILARRSPESHWHNAEVQEEMSGKPRLRWEDMHTIDGTLLAKSADKQGVALLIQDAWNLLFAVIDDDHNHEIALQMYSARFLRACLDLDIDLDGVTFHISNGTQLNGKDQVFDFLRQFDTSETGSFGKTFREMKKDKRYLDEIREGSLFAKIKKFLDGAGIASWHIEAIIKNKV